LYAKLQLAAIAIAIAIAIVRCNVRPHSTDIDLCVDIDPMI